MDRVDWLAARIAIGVGLAVALGAAIGIAVGHKWMARIQTVYIGLFGTEEDAAMAYDQEAIRRFGAFARTNFPRGPHGS